MKTFSLHRHPWPTTVGVCLLLVPASVWGASSLHGERTFDTVSNPRISLSNLDGTVVVKSWDKSQVHAEYSVSSLQVEVDSEAMPSRGQAEKLHFDTHILNPQAMGASTMVDYTLEVPLDSSLEIRNSQGSLVIQRIQGDAWAESVSGAIAVNDASGQLTVRTVGGAIEIARPAGPVEASSVTGNIHFLAPLSSRIRANTTSGRILYEGNLISAGDYIMSSYSGDIDIFCPRSASFELSARSMRGKLDNEIPLKPKRHHLTGPSYHNSLFGTHNEGMATLELTSYTGSIHIRPQP